MANTIWEVFPAYAGMSRAAMRTPVISSSFPRLRGDEPVTDAATDFIRWFSPLTRG